MFSFTPLACQSLELVHRNLLAVDYSGACAAVIFLACFANEWRRSKFSWLPLYAPLLILHPVWPQAWGNIMSPEFRALSADCFFGDKGESIFLTATLLAVLITIVRRTVSIRSFLLRLTIVGWTIIILMRFLNWIPVADFFGERPALFFIVDIWDTLGSAGWRMIDYMIVSTIACVAFHLRANLRPLNKSDIVPFVSHSRAQSLPYAILVGCGLVICVLLVPKGLTWPGVFYSLTLLSIVLIFFLGCFARSRQIYPAWVRAALWVFGVSGIWWCLLGLALVFARRQFSGDVLTGLLVIKMIVGPIAIFTLLAVIAGTLGESGNRGQGVEG